MVEETIEMNVYEYMWKSLIMLLLKEHEEENRELKATDVLATMGDLEIKIGLVKVEESEE